MKWFPVALLLGSGAALAEHPLSDLKVYTSGENVRAVVALVKESDKCVLMVTGTRTELNGLVLDCRAERMDAQTTYFVIRRGREERAMRTHGDGRAGLAGLPTPFQYSEVETKKENAEALWARHQAQLAAGQLAALTKFDRAAEVAEAAKELATAAEPLNRACGTKLAFKFDWSAASDEVFKSTRAHEGCLKLINTMQDMCGRWKVVRSTFLEKVGEVRCTYKTQPGRESVFTLEGKTLTLSSNEEMTSVPGEFEDWVQEAM
jgi:hypothetical protein